MIKTKYLLITTLMIFLTTSLFAQSENTVKEAKVKIEKQVEKVSDQANEATEIASDKLKKKCSTATVDKEACKTMKETKMSNCNMDMSKKAHDMKMDKKGHGANCDCGGCKMAKAEMNKQTKAHGKDCSCASCAKS